jgi:hypothetical protein
MLGLLQGNYNYEVEGTQNIIEIELIINRLIDSEAINKKSKEYVVLRDYLNHFRFNMHREMLLEQEISNEDQQK